MLQINFKESHFEHNKSSPTAIALIKLKLTIIFSQTFEISHLLKRYKNRNGYCYKYNMCKNVSNTKDRDAVVALLR